MFFKLVIVGEKKENINEEYLVMRKYFWQYMFDNFILSNNKVNIDFLDFFLDLFFYSYSLVKGFKSIIFIQRKKVINLLLKMNVD